MARKYEYKVTSYDVSADDTAIAPYETMLNENSREGWEPIHFERTDAARTVIWRRPTDGSTDSRKRLSGI